MGRLSTFTCKKCGLSATVGGGPDSGMIVRTETRFCTNCRRLVDVTTATLKKGMTEFQDTPGRCPRCRADAAQVWNFGEPCPQCQGDIEETEAASILWD